MIRYDALDALPVRGALPALSAALEGHGTAVLVAPPGTGKTTLVPLALAGLLGDGPARRVVVAEPRRIAARAAARRMAWLLGEKAGGSVGYTVRGERVVGPRARVEVVTTGVLLQRLQRDQELAGVDVVVLDECHERHLDADTAAAFLWDVREMLRPELRLVAASATTDAEGWARLLGGAPVVEAEGVSHPVEVIWSPPARPVRPPHGMRIDPALLAHVASTVRRALAERDGDVLCFLPGVGEIARVAGQLGDLGGVEVLQVHGRAPAAVQDAVLTPGERRRVVLATSVAESSLTVPGVRVVVDSGLAREPRVDHARGLSALTTVRASQAAGRQRAGRAGREAPGAVYRCWTEAEDARLPRFPAPEIKLADLTAFALQTACWGDPEASGLALLDPPPGGAMAAARAVLTAIGAVDSAGRATERGAALARLGVHPRLGRALLDTAGEGAEAVALLSEEPPREYGDDLTTALRTARRGVDAYATRWRTEVQRLRAVAKEFPRPSIEAPPLAPGNTDGLPLLAPGNTDGLPLLPPGNTDGPPRTAGSDATRPEQAQHLRAVANEPARPSAGGPVPGAGGADTSPRRTGHDATAVPPRPDQAQQTAANKPARPSAGGPVPGAGGADTSPRRTGHDATAVPPRPDQAQQTAANKPARPSAGGPVPGAGGADTSPRRTGHDATAVPPRPDQAQQTAANKPAPRPGNADASPRTADSDATATPPRPGRTQQAAPNKPAQPSAVQAVPGAGGVGASSRGGAGAVAARAGQAGRRGGGGGERLVGLVAALAFPERVAKAEGGSFLMASGTRAELRDGSPLRGADWIAVAVADRPVGKGHARVQLAAAVDEDLARSAAASLYSEGQEVRWADGDVVARRVERLGAIELAVRPLAGSDPVLVRTALLEGLRQEGFGLLRWSPDALVLRQRLAFLRLRLGEPWPDVSDDALHARVDEWLEPELGRARRRADLARIDAGQALNRLLPWASGEAGRLDELAPERIAVPSGSRIRIDYGNPEQPVLAVKLQEMFGLHESPAVAGVPLLVHLLSPAGRPAAVTADLASFWREGYKGVRAELRGRYPKHPWPEDPAGAEPTRHTNARLRR